jgi:hypothetical protein
MYAEGLCQVDAGILREGENVKRGDFVEFSGVATLDGQSAGGSVPSAMTTVAR